MKKVVVLTLFAILSITFYEAQAQIQDALKEQQRREAQQQQAAKEQKEREYNNTITSAERNFNQQQYEQAKQDYIAARKLKPENTVSINKKIAEIDKIISDKAEEFDLLYQNTITSANGNFDDRQYERAKQDYIKARELKPENADYINAKVAEIDEILIGIEKQRAKEELDRRYDNTIASAQRNFNQRKFVEAKQDYRAALELKPENTSYIYAKIDEIEREMNKPATLYIYRKVSHEGKSSNQKYNISLGNTIICQSENRLKKIVPVATFGKKTISATINGRKAQVQIDFEPGGEYYVRSAITWYERNTGQTRTSTNLINGQPVTKQVTENIYTPILELVSNSIGKSEWNSIKDR